uniref:Uncharacterized protein n=1 Tax=Arion vulgaris TaxID=1028688 RepID=A0A0B6Z456_9EUPU
MPTLSIVLLSLLMKTFTSLEKNRSKWNKHEEYDTDKNNYRLLVEIVVNI